MNKIIKKLYNITRRVVIQLLAGIDLDDDSFDE
jgi:hypothetical protein